MEYFLETHISNDLVVAAFPVVWICLTTERNVVTTGEISSLVSDYLADQDKLIPLPHTTHILCNALSPLSQSHLAIDVLRTRPASIS